jgi:hypothetical protein
MIGLMGFGTIGANGTASNAALATVAAASLNKIKGRTPFIDTTVSPWFTGTGHRGALAANGNSDVCCTTDAVHPTSYGHLAYGMRLGRELRVLDS